MSPKSQRFRLAPSAVYLLLGLLGVVLFQNCQFSVGSKSASTSLGSGGGGPIAEGPASNGQGYEGKPFLQVLAPGVAACIDGTRISAQINYSGSNAFLTKENCADLDPVRKLDPTEITFSGDRVQYRGGVYVEAAGANSCAAHPEWNCRIKGHRFRLTSTGRAQSLEIFHVAESARSAQVISCENANSCTADTNHMNLIALSGPGTIRTDFFFSLAPNQVGVRFSGSTDFALGFIPLFEDKSEATAEVDVRATCGLAVSPTSINCTLGSF